MRFVDKFDILKKFEIHEKMFIRKYSFKSWIASSTKFKKKFYQRVENVLRFNFSKNRILRKKFSKQNMFISKKRFISKTTTYWFDLKKFNIMSSHFDIVFNIVQNIKREISFNSTFYKNYINLDNVKRIKIQIDNTQVSFSFATLQFIRKIKRKISLSSFFFQNNTFRDNNKRVKTQQFNIDLNIDDTMKLVATKLTFSFLNDFQREFNDFDVCEKSWNIYEND